MDFKTKQKLKLPYAITLVVMYLVSFILVNVGFYSPVWYTRHLENYQYDSNLSQTVPLTNCTVGLVIGTCRYPYTQLDNEQGDLGYVIRVTFYLITTAMCVLYLSFIFLVVGLVLQWLEQPIYMSFVSIVAGVLYPAAAVLVLAGTIYSEASFWSKIGNAVIITNSGGGLMLVCYIMLRMYTKIFKKKGQDIERISKF
ncbi:uncharacterized protein LOC123549958 [Mercenaria mercenaria]|uniref:uncharacterized protein LOC123549958 n=1 Tax=Mercenaria mercenaria TaxID=6596 RepID=UPI001E1D8563|nr:uncharacterized protein LOC123549958 [Mercenaria mercenaria]